MNNGLIKWVVEQDGVLAAFGLIVLVIAGACFGLITAALWTLRSRATNSQPSPPEDASSAAALLLGYKYIRDMAAEHERALADKAKIIDLLENEIIDLNDRMQRNVYDANETIRGLEKKLQLLQVRGADFVDLG